MRRITYLGFFLKNRGNKELVFACHRLKLFCERILEILTKHKNSVFCPDHHAGDEICLLCSSNSIILVSMTCIPEGTGRNNCQMHCPFRDNRLFFQMWKRNWRHLLGSSGARDSGSASDLCHVMSAIKIVKAVFSSAWNCSVMDAERQKHCKLFSERPFLVPSVLIFSVWFSKQIVLCLEDIPLIHVFAISHICWLKIKLFL